MAHTTTIRLDSQEQQAAISKIAASLGLLNTRGAGAGILGSTSKLIRAIARGDLVVTPADPRAWNTAPRPKPDQDKMRRAHSLIMQAVQYGRMVAAKKCTCADCGGNALEYHHGDYDKPLDVTPLCKKCHTKRHKEINRNG